MFEVTVEPDSLLVGVTKIGALLGLVRLFAFINAMHEWQFEKKLAKEHMQIDEKIRTVSINDHTYEPENIEEETN